MDVSPRSPNLPVRLHHGLILALALILGSLPSAQAIGEKDPIHYTADKQTWDRKTNQVELVGNASVTQPGETLKADYIRLDLKRRSLFAKGHCVYVASDSVIFGEEMVFSLDTRTGTIVGGRVSANQFTLVGDRINKLGGGRFQTHWGEYTTCRDCPGSWSFQAEDVDMQFEGYAFMKNVTAKVLDAPTLWFPYLVFPLKTIRQSGFLFPRSQVSSAFGFAAVLPFFWAINRSADMTFEAGVYTTRGERFTWEGEYALSDKSSGKANAYYLRDATREVGLDARWALTLAQTQELPWGFTEKLKLTQVSDNQYPFRIGDGTSDGNPYQTSTLMFDGRAANVSGFVSASIYRNLLLTDTTVDQNVQFDPRTVQTFPSAQLSTNDRVLFGPLAAGVTIGVDHFWRLAGPSDEDPATSGSALNPSDRYTPGLDPLRKAVRLSATPTLYSVLRPWSALSLVPTLQYKYYFYTFGPLAPDLHRGYLNMQVDLSTEFEKIMTTEDPAIPRVKHVLRPLLTYSIIPLVNEDLSHPFLQQINRLQVNGYNFDSLDIVPRTSTSANEQYFVPLGNSLAYSLNFQRIRRVGALSAPTASYEKNVDFTAGGAIDFLKARPSDAFTRLISNLELSFKQFASSTTYYFYPNRDLSLAHAVFTSASWVVDRGVRQGILTFDRSFGVNYGFSCESTSRSCTNNIQGSINYSINDFVLPNFNISYDLVQERFASAGLGIQFQSPSRCWKLGINVTFDRGRLSTTDQTGLDWLPNITLNLAGTGYGGVTSFVESLVSR